MAEAEETPVEEQTPAPAPKPQPAPAAKKKRKKSLAKRLGLSAGGLILLIAALAAAFYFYTKYQDSQDKLKHPEKLAQVQTEDLVTKVSRHLQLPTDEKPTVATVSDVSKLSGQTFFAGAQNGDKVLIYTKAKKAVLYRPGTDKVINVGPLNVNNTQ